MHALCYSIAANVTKVTLSLCGNSIHFHCWYVKKLEWHFSTGIAGGIVFSLGIPSKNGMVGKYVIVSSTVFQLYQLLIIFISRNHSIPSLLVLS